MSSRYITTGALNINVYLKGHAGDNMRVERIGRASEFTEEPAIMIAIVLRLEVLRGLMKNQGFSGRCLLGCFLYLLPANTVESRDTNPP